MGETAPSQSHSDPQEIKGDIQSLAMEMNEWRDTEAQRFTRMREALSDEIPDNDMEFVEAQIIENIKTKLDSMEKKPTREEFSEMLADHFPEGEVDGLLQLIGYEETGEGEVPPFPKEKSERLQWMLNPEVTAQKLAESGMLLDIFESGNLQVPEGMRQSLDQIFEREGGKAEFNTVFAQEIKARTSSLEGGEGVLITNFLEQVSQLLEESFAATILRLDNQESSQETTEDSIDLANLESLKGKEAGKIKEALTQQPFPVGGESISFAPYKDIEGFDAFSDKFSDVLSRGGSTTELDQAVSDWYDSLLISHSDIVGTLGEDLFAPSLETLPDILAALVEHGHVDAAGVAPSETSETETRTPEQQLDHVLEGLTMIPNEFLDNFKSSGGSRQDMIQQITSLREQETVSDEMVETAILKTCFDSCIKTYSEINDKIALIPEFDKENPDHLKVFFENVEGNQLKVAEFRQKLETLSEAKPQLVDFERIPGFRFTERSVSRADAVDKMTESFLRQYTDWLEQEFKASADATRAEARGEEAGAGLESVGNNLMESLTTAGAKPFPPELRFMVGDAVAKKLQDPERIKRGDTSLITEAETAIRENAEEHVGSLDAQEFNNLVNGNRPLSFPESYKTVPLAQLIQDADTLRPRVKELKAQLDATSQDAPEYATLEAEYNTELGTLAGLNQAIVYHQALQSVPSWALDFGTPPYADQFSSYIKSQKSLLGQNPYDPNFDPNSIDTGEMFNDWFESQMRGKEDKITSIKRLFHTVISFLKELGLFKDELKPGEQPKPDARDEFLTRQGLKETPEQRLNREAQEIADNWDSGNQIEGLDGFNKPQLINDLTTQFPTLPEMETFNTKVLQNQQATVKGLRSQSLTPKQLMFVAQNIEQKPDSIVYKDGTVTLNLSQKSPALNYELPQDREAFKIALTSLQESSISHESLTSLAADQQLDTWREANPDKIPAGISGAKLLELGLYEQAEDGSIAWSADMETLLSVEDAWQPALKIEQFESIAQALKGDSLDIAEGESELNVLIDGKARSFDNLVQLSEGVSENTKEFYAEHQNLMDQRLPEGMTIARLKSWGLIRDEKKVPEAPEGVAEGEEAPTATPQPTGNLEWHPEFKKILDTEGIWDGGSVSEAEIDFVRQNIGTEGFADSYVSFEQNIRSRVEGAGEMHTFVEMGLVNSNGKPIDNFQTILNTLDTNEQLSQGEFEFVRAGLNDPQFVTRYTNYHTKFSEKTGDMQMHELQAIGLINEGGAPTEKFAVLTGEDFDGELDDGMPMSEFWRSELTISNTEKLAEILTTEVQEISVSDFGDNEIHVKYTDGTKGDYDTIMELINQEKNIF